MGQKEGVLSRRHDLSFNGGTREIREADTGLTRLNDFYGLWSRRLLRFNSM